MDKAANIVNIKANHCISKKPKNISLPLMSLSNDIQIKLASNAAAAGEGRPKKNCLLSMSSLTLNRANLKAAQVQ